MPSEDLDATVELLRALAHPLRLQILHAVRATELSVGEIEEVTGIGQPGLSQQLAVLRKSELVASQRTGKQVFYRLDAGRIRMLGVFLDGMVQDGAPAAGSPALEPRAGEPFDPASATRGGAAGFARVLR